jgi:queuine tRNA-ribosyltransferase subunit QTRTD1
MSVADWIDLAAAAAPDVICMLSDEVSSASAGGSSRSRKSIDRSQRWILQQLSDLRSRPSLQHTAVFAAVQGGNSLDNRARACSGVSALRVDGVVLGGLNTGEEREQRLSIIKAAIMQLPPHLPRMISAASGPEDMLDAGVRFPQASRHRMQPCTCCTSDICVQAVAMGVDFMDSDYSSTLAEEGLAATFPVDWQQLQRSSPITRTVDIKDPRYSLDASPLLQGCTCAACVRHNRAYLHHLWNTHEILAEVSFISPSF